MEMSANRLRCQREEPTRCNNNNLLISKISSTCFGQSFAHLQERKTEIFTAYGILLLWWAGIRRAATWHYVYILVFQCKEVCGLQSTYLLALETIHDMLPHRS